MIVVGVGEKDGAEFVQPEAVIPRLGEVVGAEIDDRLFIQQEGGAGAKLLSSDAPCVFADRAGAEGIGDPFSRGGAQKLHIDDLLSQYRKDGFFTAILSRRARPCQERTGILREEGRIPGKARRKENHSSRPLFRYSSSVSPDEEISSAISFPTYR